MAGDWLKFEKSTLDKPEVFAIASAMDLDLDSVIGKLIRVWSWFDSQTVDGNAARVTSSQLDRVAGVTGFIDAMAMEGWAVISSEGIALPEFDRHNGETAKKRALTAKRQKKHREKSNADDVTDVTGDELPREEKRREDLKSKEMAQQAAPVEVGDANGDSKAKAKVPKTAARFPEFWAAYPVKKGKVDAERHWKNKGCDGIADLIIARVRLLEAEDEQWRNGFIPHGSTFVCGEHWNDEPTKPKDKVHVTAPAPAPETFGPKAALAKSESKLENALGYIRQQRSIGAYGEGDAADAEMQRLVAEATAKYRGQ